MMMHIKALAPTPAGQAMAGLVFPDLLHSLGELPQLAAETVSMCVQLSNPQSDSIEFK